MNARKVSIKGKRGEVSKDFSHVACELKKMKQATKKRTGTFIRIRIWFGGYKQACAVNTLKSHIGNMIIGVTNVSLGSTAIFVHLELAPSAFAFDRLGALLFLDFNY